MMSLSSRTTDNSNNAGNEELIEVLRDALQELMVSVECLEKAIGENNSQLEYLSESIREANWNSDDDGFEDGDDDDN